VFVFVTGLDGAGLTN